MSVRAAVIDVGSNSVRLLVVERGLRGAWRVVTEQREMVRLGAGLAMSGRIDPATMKAAIKLVADYAIAARRASADITEVFATASVRDAANGAAFTSGVRRATSLGVRVLSAAEEGMLAFRGAAAKFDLDSGRCAVADLGGGSLEVVRSVHGLVVSNDSVQLGALRMMEKFGGPEAAAGKRFVAMRSHVRSQLRTGLTRVSGGVRTFIGGGGGFAASLAMVKASRNTDHATREDVAAQLKQLRAMTGEERTRVPGLEPRRADIIVPALCVVGELMEFLGAESFEVHANGIRDGMIMDVLERSGDAGLEGRGIGPSAHQLAELNKDELAHSEHVRDLALQLLAALESHAAGGRWGGHDARELLEAGALLHDIGTPVDYSKHHLFGEAVVMNAHLPWWSERQRRIVALLARHHRKEPAEPGGATLAGLTRADARLVVRLGAVLRVADALDHSHKGKVTRVGLERSADGAWELVVRARADVRHELRTVWKKGAPLRELLGGNLRTVLVR